MYKTQIIITNNKGEEVKMLHNRRIIFIAESDFGSMGEIFRRYLTKGLVGIYSEISSYQ